MPELNLPAPDFALPDLVGASHSLAAYRGRVAVVNFWSAECPWARRADEALQGYLTSWGDRVAVLPVAANANETPEEIARVAAERGLPLVLHDSDRQVADLYEARTTPHFFVIDPAGNLRYRGALDDVTFRKRQPDVPYLQEAVEAVLAGADPEPAETPPYGCLLVRFNDEGPPQK